MVGAARGEERGTKYRERLEVLRGLLGLPSSIIAP